MKYSFILLMFLLMNLPAFAQEEERDFSDEIVASEIQMEFKNITADSARRLVDNHGATEVKTDDLNIALYKYEEQNNQYLMLRINGSWKIALINIYSQSSLDYELVTIDGDTKGVLISNYSSIGRGGRFNGYDNNSSTYELLNIETGKVYFLGSTNTNDAHWYEGYVASDTGSEEREMEEMDNQENWKRSHAELSFEIKIEPGKLTYENIVCDACDIEGLDSVSAIQYVWKRDKLVKDRVVTVK